MDTCLGWAEWSTLRTKTMILKIQMVECFREGRSSQDDPWAAVGMMH